MNFSFSIAIIWWKILRPQLWEHYFLTTAFILVLLVIHRQLNSSLSYDHSIFQLLVYKLEIGTQNSVLYRNNVKSGGQIPGHSTKGVWSACNLTIAGNTKGFFPYEFITIHFMQYCYTPGREVVEESTQKNSRSLVQWPFPSMPWWDIHGHITAKKIVFIKYLHGPCWSSHPLKNPTNGCFLALSYISRKQHNQIKWLGSSAMFFVIIVLDHQFTVYCLALYGWELRIILPFLKGWMSRRRIF